MARTNTLPTIQNLAEMKPGPRTKLIRSLDEDVTTGYLKEFEAFRESGAELGKHHLYTKDSLSARLGYLNKVNRPGDEHRLEDLTSYAHKDVKAIVYGRVNEQMGIDEPDGLSFTRTTDLLVQVNEEEKLARQTIGDIKSNPPVDANELQAASRTYFKLKSLGQFLGGHANYLTAQNKDPLETTLKDVLHLRADPLSKKLEELQQHPAGDVKIDLLLMEASMWTHAGTGDGRHSRIVHELAHAYAATDPARDVGKTLFDLENTSKGIREATIELLPEGAVDQLLGLAVNRDRRLQTSTGEKDVLKSLSERKLAGIQLDDLLKWEQKQVGGYIKNYGFMEVNELLEHAQGRDLGKGQAIVDLIEDRKSSISNPETQAGIAILKDKLLSQFRGSDLEAVAQRIEKLSDPEKAHLGAMAEDIRDLGIQPRGLDNAVLDLFIEARAEMTEGQAVMELTEEHEIQDEVEPSQPEKLSQRPTQDVIPGTEAVGPGYNLDAAQEIARLIPVTEQGELKPILDEINEEGLTMIREELGKMDRDGVAPENVSNIERAIGHIDERLADIAREAQLERDALKAVAR